MVEGDRDMWVGLCERKKCRVPSLEPRNQEVTQAMGQ